MSKRVRKVASYRFAPSSSGAAGDAQPASRRTDRSRGAGDASQAPAFSTRVRKSPTPMVTEAARSASPALPSSVTAIPVASATVLPVT